jgi:AraC-like DNA-binding protein
LLPAIGSVEAWEEALSRHLAVTGIAASAPEPFRGILRARVLDVARLLHLEVSPHRLQGIPSEDDPAYQFVLPVQGSVRTTQEARSAVVEPGRFAVLDTTVAYELTFEDAATLMVIRVPRQVIGIPPILLRQVTGLAIGVDGDLVVTVMPLLVRLADDLIIYSRHSPARLAYNLADLLTTVLLEHLSDVVPGGSAHGLMLEITTYLDDHLGDQDLSAETVASAHYISPRYLRKLFEGQHLKVSEWIRARRLESCRRQLVDPVLADEPISVIAGRWGFPDPAHFSRLFKATYGRSPRQFRRDGLGQERDDAAKDR